MDWTQIDSTFLRQRKGENDEKGVSNIGSADTSPNNGARGMEKDPFEVSNLSLNIVLLSFYFWVFFCLKLIIFENPKMHFNNFL